MTDTPQQKQALRSNATARKVRALFPEGQRVETSGGAKGHVRRHVPALTSLGGVLLVEWENPVFGVKVGRIVPTVANVWPIDEDKSQLVGQKISPAQLRRYDLFVAENRDGRKLEVTGTTIETSQGFVVPVRNQGEIWLRKDELVTLVGRV